MNTFLRTAYSLINVPFYEVILRGVIKKFVDWGDEINSY